jgi:hypothetical protein
MPGDLHTYQAWRAQAAVRAADALLRMLGGTTAYVRSPAALAAGDAAQLGLAGVVTEDVELSPVVVRSATRTPGDVRDGQHKELLIPASTLERVREIRDVAAAKEFFAVALGVVLAGRLLRVDSFAAEEFSGVPYLYRVSVSD